MKDWDWIRVYWVVYMLLSANGEIVTLKIWNEVVKNVRTETGALLWPSVDELKSYSRDDLFKYLKNVNPQ